MAKQKPFEEMTPEERSAWLKQYIADAPKRLAEYDRFTKTAAISMGATLLVVPVAYLVATIIKALQ
jgi:hypothetical protein